MVIQVVYLIMEAYCLVQLLDDVCTKNGWGTPSYSLHSTSSLTGASHSELQLFLYNIKIPAINIPFQPTKLSTSVDEAQRIAAEHCLMQLGYPVDCKLSIVCVYWSILILLCIIVIRLFK